MVILRSTRKLTALRHEALPASASSDTALGDWYVNRIVVHRRPLLLLVSSESLLAMILPARDVRGLPERLVEQVAGRLARAGIPASWIAAERAAMAPVRVAKTVDRSVLGTVVDFAKVLPYILPEGPWGARALEEAEDQFARTPCRITRSGGEVLWPGDRARACLETRWGDGGVGREGGAADSEEENPGEGRTAGGKAPRVLQFRVDLRGVRPPIWRRIQLREACTFWELHCAIQDAMGWLDMHLHQFEAVHPRTGLETVIGLPDRESWVAMKAGWSTRVSTYMKHPGDAVNYLYDFGDGWEHTVELEKVLPADGAGPYPRCVAGRRACPPEDCGGVWGYGEIVGGLSEFQEEYEGWDPEAFDPKKVIFEDPVVRRRWREEMF